MCYNACMKALRITFCLLACACLAAAVPIGIFCDVIYLVLDLFVALAFGGGMLLCKRKADAKTHTPDYMNSAEENEEIRREHKDDLP